MVIPREVPGHTEVVVEEGGEEEVVDTRLVLESHDTHLAGNTLRNSSHKYGVYYS